MPKDWIAKYRGRFDRGWDKFRNETLARPTILEAARLPAPEFVNGIQQKPLPRGDVTLRNEFEYDGGHPGSGGTGRLLVNGEKVTEGRIDRTVPFVFSADETLDLGTDLASPVTEAFTNGDSHFAGELQTVTIDIGKEPAMEPEDAAKKKVAALLVRH